MIKRVINRINLLVDNKNAELYIEDNNSINIEFGNSDEILEFIYKSGNEFIPLSVYF